MNRIIEKWNHIASYMQMPEFPCIKVHFSEQRTGIVNEFLSSRENNRWLLIADHAAHTQHQLWTAWLLTVRGFSNGNALAHSPDAEFLRYLAGTHHVSEAFKKAGIQEGDQYAWLIYLPYFEPTIGEINPNFEAKVFREKGLLLAQKMGMTELDDKPQINIEGLRKLGLKIEMKNINLEDLVIGHIISANFNS